MSKKILFMSSAKLTAISLGLLLVIFCTIGMSFTPGEEGENLGNPNDSTYVTGPRRSHWTTSQTTGSGCNQSTTYTYHHKNDYGKVIAHSLGGGSVSVSGNHTTSASTNSSATAAGTTSYVTWNSNMSPNENTDASSGTEPTEAALIMAHTNEVTFTATPAEGYYFVGWYAEEGCTTQKSDKDHPEYSEEFTIPNYGYTGGSQNTQYQSSGSPWEQHRYAKFAVIPGINITFLAPSTPSVNRGTYTVTSQNTITTISTSNQTIEVKGTVLEASLGEAYEFVDWYKRDGSGTETIISTENPSEQLSFLESVSVGVHWRELHNNMNMTFKAVELDGDDNPVGSYTVNSTTVTTSDYVYNTGSAYRFSPTLKATPADGYIFTGWYIKNGKKKEYLSTESTWTPTFTDEITLYAGFAFVGYTEEQKAQFKANGQYFTDLTAANNAAKSASTKTIVCTRDGILPPGNYEISSGVTLYIPYNTSESPLTSPAVLETATALSAYRTLSFAEGANITVNGNISVGGQIMAGTGSTHTGGYPHGACGVIDMSKGGHIELNDGANLYVWGFIKGQDMDQGNNTINVGTVTANSGSAVWEDFSYGDFRGGSACSAIKGKESTWKFFPFQSYSIHNVEIPVTFKYGSADKCYTCLKTSFGTEKPGPFIIIGSSNSLFKLKDSKSTVRKWYDPTTDLMCYELSGTSQLDALEVDIYVSVNSANYNLPIASNMHIILADCDMTLSKPMLIQPGAVIEIKNGASATLSSNMYLFDVDNWGMYVYGAYFKPFKNLTLHKNRGDGSSKDLLDDAKLIVDGTLNVTGKLYSTAGGANIMGNGGGKINFSALPSATNIVMCTSTNTNENVAVNSANLCNDDASYTKSIASTTFHNVHGRWFTADDKDEKENHTYKFTYITSGAVSGGGGTSDWTPAVYSWDKTGLELRQKWFNVTADCNENGHYWWHGQGEQSSWFYNWTLNSDWHQFMPTATEGMYSGSNNKIYTKTDCAWEELGETDVNCLYTIGGVKKALVDGEFIALEPNNNDPAYHAADDATKYYICFSGCNWHEATKYENAEKAYVVDEDIFIWYDGAWMNAEWRDPFFYTLDETDVPIYYEYLNGEWVLSDPYIRVTDGLENRTYWFLDEAFAFASGTLRTSPTIKILRDYSRATTPVSYTGANKTCILDLNGHTLELEVAGAGTSEVKMFTINAAGTTFTITDNTIEKNGELKLIASVNTATSTKRWSGIYLQNGSLIMQNGTVHVDHTYTWKSNSDAGFISGILVASAKTFTMNGGTLHVEADYNPYGINAASGTPTITLNGGTLETIARTKDSPYAIYGYGTINITGGTINAIAKANSSAMGIYVVGNGSTANISGGTILARATSSAQGVRCWGSATVTGDYNAETPDNTPKSRSYSIMNITGGTITAECTTSTTSYGVISYGTTNISGGTITSTVQKSNQHTAYGVYTAGGTTTISAGANITANAPTKAYGVCSTGANGDSNRGWPHVGVVNITGGTITANTTNTTTAYGLLVTGATWTINKTNGYSVFNGDYASAGTATVTGGHFYANAKTTLSRGIAVAATVTKNAASATPKCTINGGYYKMTGTGDLLGCNASALPADFQINGGYYSHDGNLATYTPSPKHVLTLASGDANRPPYYYKVAEAYLVTFKNEDGTANIIDPVYQEVGTAPVCSTEPTKESTSTNSFTFDGWATEANGAKVYEPNGLPNVTSAGATYYAHFATTTLKYRVHFDAATNGGECATENIYVNPGTAVGSLPTATKYGYTFNGWYTASTGGTKLEATTVINADADYYAQFTANSHALTWDLAGGTVSTAGKIGSTTWPAKNATGTPSTSVAFGTILTTIPVVTKTGYTFNRWDPVPTSSMPDEDVIYTALWNPNINTAYTVKHYLQNVDGTYPADPVETQSLTGTTATSVTPAVKSYDGFVSPTTQTVTIAAAGTTVVEYQYARRHYTFTLDAYTNGGTSEVPSIEVIHGATIGAVPPDAQKGCNEFLGWFTKPEGGVKITSEFVIEYDMKKLYAQFSDDVRTYPIIYNAGAHGTGTVAAGTKTCGEDATLSSSTFTRDGYAQTGWSLTDGGAQAYALGGTYTANASLTLYPVWSAVTYNLTYEGLNGATNSNPATYTIETATITLANPGTRVGYTFTGWTCGGNPITQIALGSTGDKVITANWSAVTYNLTYEGLNGASNSNPATYTVETATFSLSDPGTRTGYNFTGWTCGSSPITQITLGSTGDKTITANWSAVTYNITYEGLNGASNSNPATYTVETATFTLVDPGTREGYTFTGWTCGGNPITQIALGSTGDKTITANWSAVTYNLTYEGLNGASNSNPATYTVETATFSLSDPGTRTGYNFTGWTCDSSPITQITLGSTGDKTITANWEQTGVTITWKSEDGETTLETDELVAIGATPSFNGTAPTKATTEAYTYTFDGWTTEANGGGTYYSIGELPTVSAAATYYAHFAATANVASVKVGSAEPTYYTTLQAAFDYAANKTTPTITVLKDISSLPATTYTNTSKTTVTFDLNGHKVSGGANPLLTLTSASNNGGEFVIKSTVEGGKIYNEVSSTSARNCVTLTKGKLKLVSGTISNKNKSTGASYALKVASGRTFTMEGGTLEANGKKNAYALHSTGTSNVSGGTIKATETSDGYAGGILVLGGTTNVSGTTAVQVSGTSGVYGAKICAQPSTSGAVYAGTLEVTGGTFTVNASTGTAVGVYSYAGTRAIDYATNSSKAKNYACAGTATISGGEFTVTSTGATAYGVYVTGTVSIATAKDADGNATYPEATATSTATVTGGKFNMSGVSSVAVNTLATNTQLDVQGGWYNVADNLSVYVAPTKSCNYRVLPLDDAKYKYKVAEAYTVTFNNYDGTQLQSGLVEKGQTPTYNGATPTKPQTEEWVYTFDNWTPGISAVTANVTYTATFTQEKRKYHVTWTGESIIERTDEVAYGETPVYGELPTKDPDVSQVYTFEWMNMSDASIGVKPVTGDVTYSGSFTGSPRPYTIRFVNDDGSELQSSEVGYGSEPGYTGTPVSAIDDSYEFIGWTPSITLVGGPATYVATYKRTIGALTVNTPETISVNTSTSSTTIENNGTLTIGDENSEVALQSTTIIVEPGGNLEVTTGATIEADVFIIQATTEEKGPNEALEEVQVSGELVSTETGSQTLSAIYYDLTRKHGEENFLARVWYAVAVPWAVEVPTYNNGGVYIKRGDEFVQQRLGATFDLLSYDGACRAQNGADADCWVYLENEIAANTAPAVMVPGKLYMIYLTEETSTIRFKKKAGEAIHTNSLTVSAHDASNENDANWNGIANPATYRAYMNVSVEGLVQKFVPGSQPRDPGRYMALGLNDKQAVGQPFFVQIDPNAGTTVLAKRTNNSSAPAPRRVMNDREQETRYAIGIAANGKLADRLYVQTTDEKEDQYVIGQDLSKMGVSSYVAQMWVNRYDSKLCLNTVTWTRNKADYPLGIYAPQAGEYIIFAPEDVESGDNIYLTLDGRVIWNLTSVPYYASLEKGTTTRYGLRIVRNNAPAVTTGVDEVQSENAQCTKVIMDDHVYILRGEEIYTITGQKAK